MLYKELQPKWNNMQSRLIWTPSLFISSVFWCKLLPPWLEHTVRGTILPCCSNYSQAALWVKCHNPQISQPGFHSHWESERSLWIVPGSSLCAASKLMQFSFPLKSLQTNPDSLYTVCFSFKRITSIYINLQPVYESAYVCGLNTRCWVSLSCLSGKGL